MSPAFSVGVEEEVMILDAETLALSPSVELLIGESEKLELPGRLKTELFASVVELNTDICDSVGGAHEALHELRRAVSRIAEDNSLRIAAAGSHPFSDPEQQQIAADPRYKEFVGFAGVSARRQGVCGLHVHVGMPTAEACWATLRFGPGAELIHPEGTRLVRAPELARELLDLVGPAAEELGTTDLLAALDPSTCEGERQLEIGEREGLEAVCADLVERTLG